MTHLVVQVRHSLQLLPTGPDNSDMISKLEKAVAELQARAARYAGKIIVRPVPGLYIAVSQLVSQFLASLGNISRLLALLDALQVVAASSRAALVCLAICA